jgi:hypothetical protein
MAHAAFILDGIVLTSGMLLAHLSRRPIFSKLNIT